MTVYAIHASRFYGYGTYYRNTRQADALGCVWLRASGMFDLGCPAVIVSWREVDA